MEPRNSPRPWPHLCPRPAPPDGHPHSLSALSPLTRTALPAAPSPGRPRGRWPSSPKVQSPRDPFGLFPRPDHHVGVPQAKPQTSPYTQAPGDLARARGFKRLYRLTPNAKWPALKTPALYSGNPVNSNSICLLKQNSPPPPLGSTLLRVPLSSQSPHTASSQLPQGLVTTCNPVLIHLCTV